MREAQSRAEADADGALGLNQQDRSDYKRVAGSSEKRGRDSEDGREARQDEGGRAISMIQAFYYPSLKSCLFILAKSRSLFAPVAQEAELLQCVCVGVYETISMYEF